MRHFIEMPNMKPIGFLKTAAIFMSCLFVLFCGLLYYQHNPWLWSKYKLGQQIIIKIEKFQAEHHRLPDNMDEIEPKYFSESGPIYYQKLSDNHFEIWFGLSLGESYIYDSEEKKWH